VHAVGQLTVEVMSTLGRDRHLPCEGLFQSARERPTLMPIMRTSRTEFASCAGQRLRERSVAIWSFFNLTLIRASTGVN